MAYSRDALSDHIIRVESHWTLRQATNEFPGRRASHAAVFECEEFIGVVRIPTRLSDQTLDQTFEIGDRTFAELLPVSTSLETACSAPLSPVVTPDVSLDEVGRLLSPLEVEAVAVIGVDGKYHGIITRMSLLQVLLEERDQIPSEVNVSHGHGDVKNPTQAEVQLREAESRYRTLFEQSSDAFMLIDPKITRAIEFNDRMPQLLGYSRDEFAQLRISDYEVIETPQEVRSHIEKIVKEGGDEFETILRTKQGEVRDVHLVIRAIQFEGRTVFHNTVRDITDLKRADLLRQEQETWLQVVLASTLDPMFTIDIHGEILFASDSVKRIFGWMPREVIGQNIDLLMPEPYRSEHAGYLSRYLRTGHSSLLGNTRELEAMRKDCSTFPCEITVWRVDLPTQKDPVFTGFIRDITERKRTEEHARKVQAEMTHVARAVAP